jgi:hypothetical protein
MTVNAGEFTGIARLMGYNVSPTTFPTHGYIHRKLENFSKRIS